MKKQFFFMAAAAIALASCSSEDVVEVNNGNPIDFRVAMGGANSRGAEMTTDGLTSFSATARVTGGDAYFEDVTFNETGGIFTSNPTYFWPKKGTLDFYAYSPVNADLADAVAVGNAGMTITDFEPAAEITNQVDLIVASSLKTVEAETTPLTFNHQLSQIEILAKNENTGYTFSVAGVRIGSVASKGTLTYVVGATPTSSWAAGAEKTSYEVTFGEIELEAGAQVLTRPVAEGATMLKDNAMLIPQQLVAWQPETADDAGSYIAVLINITTTGGAQIYPPKAEGESEKQYAWAAVAIPTKWEPGKKYAYTLDFSEGAGYVAPNFGDSTTPEGYNVGDKILGGAIKFSTVTVDSWENGETAEKEVM